jgi:DNA modification methylase/ParB-like chromosome segregation protein Spo0J
MKLFQIEERKISEIIIQDRARTDIGEIKSLAENISMIGQLSPILINSDNVLIDGFRRIAAIKELGKDTIEVRIVDGITQDDHFLIELLSNMDRKEFTWYEEIELKAKLHNYWKAAAEAKKKTWGYRETAKRLRCSLGGLSTDLAFADALRVFPDLKAQATKSRARELYKSMGKQAVAIQRMESFTDKEKERLQDLFNGNVDLIPKNTISAAAVEDTAKAKQKIDSLDEQIDEEEPVRTIKVIYVAENYKTFIEKIPDNSVGMVELDPPYAIDFNTNYGKTSKIQSKATDWTEKELYEFYFNYLPLIYKKMLDASWVLCWTGKEHYIQINKIAEETGFTIQQPGSWPKPGGSTNQPKKNMISNWEMFLLFRKGEAQFNTPSFSASIPEMITNSASKRIHQWEKPIEVYDFFLKALSRPGTIFLSPFAGSGNCLVSAAKANMIPIGCDKLQKYIPQFYQNIKNYFGVNTKIEGL